MDSNLVVSITENNDVVIDIYNATIRSSKKLLFGRRKPTDGVDVVMASFVADKTKVRELIDILEDTLEELEEYENGNEDKIEDEEDLENYY